MIVLTKISCITYTHPSDALCLLITKLIPQINGKKLEGETNYNIIRMMHLVAIYQITGT